MKALLLALLLTQSFIATSQATMVCTGKTNFGTTLELTIADDHVAHLSVSDENGNVELKETFQNLDNVWDGHMTGLITASGLSVKYENQYGCIRHVVITTNVRGGGVGYIDTVKVAACRGGSTRDELCLRGR